MTPSPTAWTLLREGLAVVFDAVGLVLLFWLSGQVLFGGSQPFETEALWVGAMGAVACWLKPGARRNLPLPMVAYVAVAMLSAAVHQWPAIHAEPSSGWGVLFTPALYLITMLAVAFGGGYLLRSSLRVSMFVVLLAISIHLLAIQIMFDRTVTGFVYNEGGSSSLPSVAQWGGLHQTGLLLVIGLPLSLSVSVLGGSLWRVVAGLTLSLWLLVVAFFNGSRAGIAVMAFTMILMLASKLLATTVSMRIRGLLAAVILSVPLGLWYAATHVTTSMRALSLTAGRLPIWSAAAHVALDHPWLGVGPGNYARAMFEGGYAERYLYQVEGRYSGAEQAHNLLLHVAAETGVLGALLLLALFLWLVRGCWSAFRAGEVRLISLGLLFALLAFLLRSMSDNFLDGLVSTDRTRVLVWSLFAAALAVSRLPLPADRRRA